MKRLNNTSALSIVLALSLSTAGIAAAQSSDQEAADKDYEMQTVTVTATKSGAQELQTVPLAIQAFGGEELKQRNIGNVDDLVSTIPGAYEGQRQSVASRSYNVRGAGGSNANGDSPIGYYLDDVPFVVTNFGIAPPVRFLDIERVEVLRGPQGTLYGQGSSGGVFIFHTRDPNLNEVEYAAEAEISQTKDAQDFNYGVAGAVSVPIIKDRLAVRVSGGHSRNPGWADVYYGANDGTPDEEGANDIKNDDIRFVVLAKPADNVTLRGQYWHFRPRQDYLGGMASVNDPAYYENTGGGASFGNGDFKLWSLSATVDFDHFSLTSATSKLEGNFGIQVPIGGGTGFFSSQFYPEMFSQEIRANSNGNGPFHWIVGASYQDGSGPQENRLENPSIGLSINADNDTITENYAFFGEASYELFDGKLVPLVGLRTYSDDRTFKDGTATIPSKKNVDTWRLNLSYLPTEDITMFVTAATGFRAGIVQSQAQVESLVLAGIPASTALDPETSKNYEFGAKWRSPDRSLSLGVNLYQTEYKDLQTNTPGGIQDVNGFSNFGDATTKGVDFEARWSTPIDGLTLSAVGNFNDSKFDNVAPAVQVALPLFRPGSRLVNSIESNYRIDASYSRDITANIEGFGNISYSRTGDRLQSSGVYADPYSLVNATVGVRSGDYELALIGNNLGDERGPTMIGNAGYPAGSGPTPMTIGLRFRVLSR